MFLNSIDCLRSDISNCLCHIYKRKKDTTNSFLYLYCQYMILLFIKCVYIFSIYTIQTSISKLPFWFYGLFKTCFVTYIEKKKRD